MEWVSGNIFIRSMGGDTGLNPGDIVGGHTHSFDHTTILFCGRWQVKKWLNNIVVFDFEKDGPFHVLIEANARHQFKFLGPGVGHAWCIYSHRTPQGEISQVETGWYEAYAASSEPLTNV
jgi:hypothetical protein